MQERSKSNAAGRSRKRPDNRILSHLVLVLPRKHSREGLNNRAFLRAGAVLVACAIGRSGIIHGKREGDGGTPAGGFHLVSATFRADRIKRPAARLPTRITRPTDGWCDDSSSGNYNEPVRLPFKQGHEQLWREDGLYDIVIVTDHNRVPRIKGRGSAIFIHCVRDDFGPTAGCVALRLADMRRLLPRLSRRAAIIIPG